MASGADDILDRARVVATLSEAVADCGLVVGATARLRAQYYWPAMGVREAAARIRTAAVEGPVAVVFGTERTGLTNAELELCNAVLHIPANPEYESLNLAQAVQVVAYELYAATAAPRIETPRGVDQSTGHGQAERFDEVDQAIVATYQDKAKKFDLEGLFARLKTEIDKQIMTALAVDMGKVPHRATMFVP